MDHEKRIQREKQRRLDRQLRIDQEFRDVIPPLSEEELAQLEKNLIANGCIDPIITWKHMVLDGHNRVTICRKNKIPFQIKELKFGDKKEAVEWMILNQFGRRNLNPYQRGVLALKLKPIYQGKAKENISKAVTASNLGNISHLETVDTGKELGKRALISDRTIDKVEYLQAHASDEIKEQLQKGELSVSKAYQDIKDEDEENLTELHQNSKNIAVRFDAWKQKATPRFNYEIDCTLEEWVSLMKEICQIEIDLSRNRSRIQNRIDKMKKELKEVNLIAATS